MIAGMTGVNLGLPKAWVVKCKKCSCTITCRAIDPQDEHPQQDKADPAPQDSVIVTCSCCWAAYRYSPAEIFKDSPGPSSTCYDRGKPTIKSGAGDRFAARWFGKVRRQDWPPVLCRGHAANFFTGSRSPDLPNGYRQPIRGSKRTRIRQALPGRTTYAKPASFPMKLPSSRKS